MKKIERRKRVETFYTKCDCTVGCSILHVEYDPDPQWEDFGPFIFQKCIPSKENRTLKERLKDAWDAWKGYEILHSDVLVSKAEAGRLSKFLIDCLVKKSTDCE